MENSFRDEKSELMREVEDLRLRLQMAAEEYKKVYTECRQLQVKLDKRRPKEGANENAMVQVSSTSVASKSVLQVSLFHFIVGINVWFKQH